MCYNKAMSQTPATTATLTLNCNADPAAAQHLAYNLPVTFVTDSAGDHVFTGPLDALHALTRRYVTPISGHFTAATIAFDFDHFYSPVIDCAACRDLTFGHYCPAHTCADCNRPHTASTSC
jgi:hypothetical protein